MLKIHSDVQITGINTFPRFYNCCFQLQQSWGKRYRRKYKTTQTTPSQNCGRGGEEAGRVHEYIWHFKNLHLLFSDQLAGCSKKKSCSFWEYSGLKGVDRSFLELIAWRLCQPSFQTFEQNYHRYCILKSGFAVSTPCKFRICLRNGRRTHICFTREIVVSILSCFITRFLLLLWNAEEQEYSSPQLNSRNIRQQLGGGLCRFLSGAPSSWASGPSIWRINSLHKASWWPASHPLAILQPASLIRVLRI